MAKYLLLIYGNEQRWETMSPEEQQRIDDGHAAFRAAAGSGILAGGALELTETATSLRNGTPGRPAVSDGPFVETKEVLGGFYVIDAADLDSAIALAERLAEVRDDHSGVEVRPIQAPS